MILKSVFMTPCAHLDARMLSAGFYYLQLYLEEAVCSGNSKIHMTVNLIIMIFD